MKTKTNHPENKENANTRAAADRPEITRLASQVMPRLEVGNPDSSLEVEAEQTADKVMSAASEIHGLGKVQGPTNNRINGSFMSAAFAEQNLKATPINPAPWQETLLKNPTDTGHPLPSQVRPFMEKRFDVDFTQVRIHTGNQADMLNRSLNAKAFTKGNDIYFRSDFNVDSFAGKHLLAHELTHVLQQAASLSHAKEGKKGDVKGLPAFTIAGNNLVHRSQDVDKRRGSRIDVAASVQAFRVTYPDEGGGLLTQALLRQLRRAQTAGEATQAVGRGSRRFGSRARSAEERAGVSLGQTASPTDQSTAQRVAIVVGNGNYDPVATMGNTVLSNRPLTTTIPDAQAVADRMIALNYTVTLLTDQNATQINTALVNQIGQMQQGSELFFFFSGHGSIEGLLGIDGSVFTPAQMVAIRDTARSNMVNLVINTDACHSGIFADAIRGAELSDTLLAAQSQPAPSASLVDLLQAAVEVQTAKDDFNTAIWDWWRQRYEIENRMGTSSDQAVITEWDNHYNQGRDIWNDFVTACNPLLATLRSTASAAGLSIRLLSLAEITGNLNSDKEALIQAGLDDVDTLLNRVLTWSDNNLP